MHTTKACGTCRTPASDRNRPGSSDTHPKSPHPPFPKIGHAPHIGEPTVKTHVARIFAILDVTHQTAAVSTALAPGIRPLPV